MSIEIKNITKKFGAYTVLNDISLQIETGGLLALLGPSGCGKTTLLRIIAGLEYADSGQIFLYDEELTGTSAKDRGIGFVFQHYALFRHMKVFDNVAFGLQVMPKKARPSKAQIQDSVQHLLEMVQMEWARDRYPHQLSGGQRQRIALARALAMKPKVLLLDEPFSALDAKVRLELRRWLRKLHEEMRITTVFVTHDQEEALELADRIVIINKGRLEQEGTPEDVYDNPANAFVYNFLGNVNVFHCRINQGQAQIGDVNFKIPDNAAALGVNPIQGFVRPHEVDISRVRRDDTDIEAVIAATRIIGPMIGLELECISLNGVVEAEIHRDAYRELDLKKNMHIFIKLKNVKFFSNDSYTI
ncbi:MAG: sulfate ABC transporter ATP-binding protein [Pseudomonadota bacterium]